MSVASPSCGRMYVSLKNACFQNSLEMDRYNNIINALQPEERRLFSHHIRNLDRKIGPGISKYIWVSSVIKEFFVRDALRECAKVWDFVSQYKDNIAKINANATFSTFRANLAQNEIKDPQQQNETVKGGP